MQMSARIKITPRAKRAAEANGIDPSLLPIPGTGYLGGICENDILDYIRDNPDVPIGAGAGVRISHLARRIAEAEGIDTASVTGSGSHGRILKADVLSAASGKASDRESAPAESAVTEAAMNGDKAIREIVPYAGVRKIIGERLAQSKFTAPHLYFTQEVDLSALLALRKQVNAAQEKKTSVTDYIAKAVVSTLLKYPEMNASLIDGEIQQYANVNLGIAVAAPGGLIVPVVKNADKQSLVELSQTASLLFDKARNGKLLPNEYSDGTFTISNLGMFGIENFTAIINPPESGILAISATKDKPVVINAEDGTKSVEIRPIMNITLTVDHRIIDGLLAAQFVTEIKRILENPIEIIIK
jgi:pyruvate dehydrogenase E2 component (dihydrolipoamide acetyltransferase)